MLQGYNGEKKIFDKRGAFIMNYQECRAYIDDSAKYGSVLGLDNMREMLDRLGNPQDAVPYVHVAGTNGKGSVIAYLYTTLTRAGYKVGRYISPTLYSYRERLEIAGEKISQEDFAKYVTEISRSIDQMTAVGMNHPTPFEIETAAAFLYFKEENCDLVLLETGMGGNLDATNIVKNTKLAVLVSISMDHMSFLGNTLAQIAEKKAGIIKDGCRVVTARQKPEAMQVIERISREHGAKCTIADASEAEVLKESCLGQTIRYRGEEYEIPLAGVYQKENAVVALNALKVLDELGFPTAAEQKKEGLRTVNWNGRFTVICKKPLFVVDGAHNPAAADMMAASIEHYFKGKRIIYIMGVFADKDYRSVIQKTAHFADRILTIQTPDNIRALPAGELAKTVSEYNPNVQAMDTIKDAVEEAFSLAGEQDVIIAFGSLSFIGEMTDIVENL